MLVFERIFVLNRNKLSINQSLCLPNHPCIANNPSSYLSLSNYLSIHLPVCLSLLHSTTLRDSTRCQADSLHFVSSSNGQHGRTNSTPTCWTLLKHISCATKTLTTAGDDKGDSRGKERCSSRLITMRGKERERDEDEEEEEEEKMEIGRGRRWRKNARKRRTRRKKTRLNLTWNR